MFYAACMASTPRDQAISPAGVSGAQDKTRTRDRVGYVRDWMHLRPGENEGERAARLYHTCYACGAYIVDQSALAAHEDECWSGH